MFRLACLGISERRPVYRSEPRSQKRNYSALLVFGFCEECALNILRTPRRPSPRNARVRNTLRSPSPSSQRFAATTALQPPTVAGRILLLPRWPSGPHEYCCFSHHQGRVSTSSRKSGSTVYKLSAVNCTAGNDLWLPLSDRPPDTFQRPHIQLPVKTSKPALRYTPTGRAAPQSSANPFSSRIRLYAPPL